VADLDLWPIISLPHYNQYLYLSEVRFVYNSCIIAVSSLSQNWLLFEPLEFNVRVDYNCCICVHVIKMAVDIASVQYTDKSDSPYMYV
jgi:hypothetical protein